MNPDQRDSIAAQYRASIRSHFVKWVEKQSAMITDIRPSEIVVASDDLERRYDPDGGLSAEDWPDLKKCCGPEDEELTQLNRDDLVAAILENALHKAGHSFMVARYAIEELADPPACEELVDLPAVEELVDPPQYDHLWITVEQSSFAEVVADLDKQAKVIARTLQGADLSPLIHPKWDGTSLWFRGALVKEYEKNAGNQFIILDAFEEANWRWRIVAPNCFLGSSAARKSLRETVDGLNRRQGIIHFRKLGSRIRWEPRRQS